MNRYPKAKSFQQTPNHGTVFAKGKPTILLLHYDAGSSAQGSIDSMMDGKAKKRRSAHFEVDRNGDVYQLSDLNLICWHSGESKWGSLTGLNDDSIGVEQANLGFMKKVGGAWMTGVSNFKNKYKGDPAGVVFAAHRNEPGRTQGWEPYPEELILSSLALCRWILDEVPTIKEILGHDQVSPGRKSDPGPAYPMDRFQALLRPEPLMSDRDGVSGEGANFSTRGPVHVVAAGDTLSSIAREYGTTLDALRSANGGALDGDVIRPGEMILLPEGV